MMSFLLMLILAWMLPLVVLLSSNLLSPFLFLGYALLLTLQLPVAFTHP